MVFSAITIANAFVSFTDPEEGDLITNLKVQKLLYYAQGLHLALYDTPLFSEELIKRPNGPVVPDVFKVLEQYGTEAIPVPEKFDYSIFSDQHMEVLTEVNLEFGQYTSIRLLHLLNEERPYQKAQLNEVISHDELISYFTSRLEN